ncbi:MAG TPA: DUF1254 domain-containing protein [Alphaproteobacteria bacterium]|nr:DUF1254 domain-containing protein [Alphaproteobacteria bacterium]
MPEITRRKVLQGGIAATLPTWRHAIAADPDGDVARDAYIWGYPLVMFGRYLDAYKKAGNPLNQFLVQSAMSTPATPGGGPNVDTIYGYTWLDLRAGPQVLYVPDVGDRYYSVQLIDMYSDVFAYVGRRATGTKAGAFAIVGPGWKGRLPKGVTAAIKAPTDDVMAFTRTYVADDNDLPAAKALQSQYAFGDLADYPRATRPPIAMDAVPLPPILDLSDAGVSFFDELCVQLAANPPRPNDREGLERFAKIGVGLGGKPSTQASPALKKALESAITPADKRIKTVQYGSVIDGWYVNFSMVAFPKDPLLRASSVKYGPGGHVPEEGLYFNADKGPDHQPLTGAKNYILRFPAGQLPPVNAFWSLTCYSPTMSMVENPIHRYAIKDKMPGLTRGVDGSLALRIQHAQPAEGTANWLPTPDGPFRLVLRTYQPGRAILDETYKLPPLEIAS